MSSGESSDWPSLALLSAGISPLPSGYDAPILGSVFSGVAILGEITVGRGAAKGTKSVGAKADLPVVFSGASGLAALAVFFGLPAVGGAACRGGDPPAAGICTTAWQCGHFPFLPAAARGVRTSPWHLGQGNSMGPSGDAGGLGLEAGVAGAGAGVAPAAGSDDVRHFPAAGGASEPGLGSLVSFAGGAGRGGLDLSPPGITITAPQCGHFPFLPAAESGVRTSCRHSVQGNSIGIAMLVQGAS